MYSNFYDYCCEIRDKKNSKVPPKSKYKSLEEFENERIESGCQKLNKIGFRSVTSNLKLNEDEYVFDIFDVGDLTFESLLEVTSYQNRKILEYMYCADFSVLYYSVSMNKFLSRKCTACLMPHTVRGNAKHLLYKIYDDELNKSLMKYLHYEDELSTISKQNMRGIFNSIRDKIIGKPFSAFTKELNTSSKIVFKYGLSDNFSRVNVEFGGDDKYFDYIRVEGFVSRCDSLEFIKSNKNKILKMYLDAIRNSKNWKKFDVPINILKLTDLILTKSNILVATFSLKETSQS